MPLPAIPYLITKPKPGVQINPLHPLSRGLVGYWLFNEGSGSRAADISGHGNHGTLNGMSPNAQGSGWGGSKFGGGLQFDGNDDYIKVEGMNGFEPVNGISVETILKPTSILDSFPIHHMDASDTDGYGISMYSRDIRASLQLSNSWYHATYPDFSANVYYYIVMTYDNETLKLYIDGVLQDSDDTPSGALPTIDKYLSIGMNNKQSWAYKGLIDFVRIYNRVLSAAEVKQLYHDPFCNLLRVPVRYVAVGGYDVSMSLTMSSALANSAQASAGASLSLDQIAAIADGGQANTNAAATLADLLGISESALATVGASLTLAKGMSISADATAVTDATLSLAQTLTIAQTTGQYIDASLSLTQSLGISDSAQVTAQASILLSKIMAVSHVASANAAASLSLAYHAALVNDASETISASIALAIQQGMSASVTIDYSASLGLAQSLGISSSAQATAEAALSLNQNLALVLLAHAVVDAGLSLDAIQFITTTATAVIAGLETPDGRTVIITFETRTTTVSEETRTTIIPSTN